MYRWEGIHGFMFIMCINDYEYFTFSLSVSKAEVASSRSRILGFLTMARAMAMRCFCPLDS